MRQRLGPRSARRIPQVERHPGDALRFEKPRDRGIAPGPVAAQHLHLSFVERSNRAVAIERGGLVGLAGDAPVGGEIDEHRLARRARRCQRGERERARAERVAFRRNPRCGHRARQRQREHQRQHGQRGRGARGRRPAAALHPADRPDEGQQRECQRCACGGKPRATDPPRQPQQGERSQRHRHRHRQLEFYHPRAGLGQRAAQRGNERQREERQRQSQPQRGEHRQRLDQRQHQRRAHRGGHERPGARGGDEGGEQPGSERPALTVSAAGPYGGQLEQPREVRGDRHREQQQSGHHQRLLQLERPAQFLPAGAQAQQQPAQREAGEHDPGGIGQPVGPRLARAGIGRSQRQRLEAEDREHAGHYVEQQPAEQRAAEDCSEAGQPRWRGLFGGERRAATRHCARSGAERQPFARAIAQHARDLRRRAIRRSRGPLELDQQQIALAPKRLRRGVVDQALGGEEHMRRAQIERRGQRDRQPHPAVGQREIGAFGQRRGQFLPPAIEARIALAARSLERADRERGRQPAAFGHADLVGAGQPVGLRRHRERCAGSRVGGNRERDQQRIVVLVDMVHQPGDQQRLGHRIARRPGLRAGRERPPETHPEARVAGVLPVTVPARFGGHRHRERHRLARRDAGSLGDQRGGDVRRPPNRRLRQRRHGEERDDEGRQDGEQSLQVSSGAEHCRRDLRALCLAGLPCRGLP